MLFLDTRNEGYSLQGAAITFRCKDCGVQVDRRLAGEMLSFTFCYDYPRGRSD